MKKILFIFFILCHVSLIAQNEKINVAILDLDPTNIESGDSKFLSDRLRIELFESGAFNVVERDKMNTILQEQGFQLSGCSSLECAVEIGQLLNVQQMIAGSIGRIENVYSITLRLINVETGAITRTAKRDYQGSLSDMLTEVIPEIAAEISELEEFVSKETKTAQNNDSRWGLQLKLGSAAHTFISNYNTAIDEFNKPGDFDDMDAISQFRNFGLEIVWDYNSDWRYNFGVDISPLNNTWNYQHSRGFFIDGANYSELSITRDFTLSYIYGGVDYKMSVSKNFGIFLGVDLGLSSLVSKSERNGLRDGIAIDPVEDNFTYVTLALKLKVGMEYAFSESFDLSIEFSPLIQTEYETAEEFTGTGPFQFIGDALFPDTMDGAGIILTVAGTYYFLNN